MSKIFTFTPPYLRSLDWVFVRGVRQQLDALRQGFNTVFPLDKLGAFTPNEVRPVVFCQDFDIDFVICRSVLCSAGTRTLSSPGRR
jgi:hypothetical protein